MLLTLTILMIHERLTSSSRLEESWKIILLASTANLALGNTKMYTEY